MSSNHIWLLLIMFRVIYCQVTYSDEDRPYKFGFNIEGYQHRQEEKDENGLIKGEYGFITADGYYRVTSYATDENGDFKILSMKNYYVGFPPEDPTTTPQSPSERLGNSKTPNLNSLFENSSRDKERNSRENEKVEKLFTNPSGLMACSDCFIPTTTKKPNEISITRQFGGRSIGNRESEKGETGGIALGQRPTSQPLNQSFLEKGDQGGKRQESNQGEIVKTNSQLLDDIASLDLNSPKKNSLKGSLEVPNFPSSSLFGNGQSLRENKKSDDLRSIEPKFPIKHSKEERRKELEEVEGNPRIGEIREGLPTGITAEDIKNLLYKFNYTTGFHGHQEYGYRGGDKEGGYFFDGRDGTERQVKYEANEFGYQPNITFIELPENDERKPKEETEKEYGLKGYEFKWFYKR